MRLGGLGVAKRNRHYGASPRGKKAIFEGRRDIYNAFDPVSRHRRKDAVVAIVHPRRMCFVSPGD
jgi:hypothetical protein